MKTIFTTRALALVYLFVMNADGSGVTQATNGGGRVDRSESLSRPTPQWRREAKKTCLED
jgi:hypothetical protein